MADNASTRLGLQRISALLARVPRPAASVSYDPSSKELALTLAAAANSSLSADGGVAAKVAASISSLGSPVLVRCSAKKRLLLGECKEESQPLTADLKIRATTGVDSSLGLSICSKRRMRLSDGSAVEVKAGAVLDSQRMEAEPTGHIRWRSPLWSLTTCQDLGLVVGLDYPQSSNSALGAAGGVSGLLQAAGKTARSHWPAGPPPVVPLLLLPLKLLQQLRRRRRKAQTQASAAPTAEGGSRRVRFTDADDVTSDAKQEAAGQPPKRRSKKAEAGDGGRPSRSKRSAQGSSEGSGQGPKEEGSRRRGGSSSSSKQSGDAGKGRRSRNAEPEQQQPEQPKRRGAWLKRLMPPVALRRQAAALGRALGSAAGGAAGLLGRATAVASPVLGDLHMEVTQLQYLPGSYTPTGRMRLRYKHGQLRLICDV